MFLQFIPAIPIIRRLLTIRRGELRSPSLPVHLIVRRFLIISFAFLGILGGMGGVGSVSGQEAGFETGVGWVKNPLMINSGAMVEGALRQMDAGNVTLNSDTTVTGHLWMPGTPQVLVNGGVTFGGTTELGGGALHLRIIN